MTIADIQAFLTQPTNLVGAAIVSALVTGLVTLLTKMGETSHRLNAEYKYEQRKEFKDVIARYHGRLLNYSNSMNHRMWNLYSNEPKGWLDVDSSVSESDYYLLSFAHRLLNLLAIIREFEEEAIIIDSRIASKSDLRIYNYVAAIRWCMTDVALFDGLEYDSFHAKDHFYSDSLRQLSDEHISEGGKTISYSEFVAKNTEDQKGPVLVFLKGLRKSEARYRWDRLVVLHLLLIGLINAIGHSPQRTSQCKINHIANQIVEPKILANLIKWLPRHEIPLKFRLQVRLAMFRY